VDKAELTKSPKSSESGSRRSRKWKLQQ